MWTRSTGTGGSNYWELMRLTFGGPLHFHPWPAHTSPSRETRGVGNSCPSTHWLLYPPMFRAAQEKLLKARQLAVTGNSSSTGCDNVDVELLDVCSSHSAQWRDNKMSWPRKG